MTLKMAVKELRDYRDSLAALYGDAYLLAKLGFFSVTIESHQFGHLPQSKALYLAWKKACGNRLKDAQAIRDALDYTVQALKKVEETITEMDQESSWQIAKSIQADKTG